MKEEKILEKPSSKVEKEEIIEETEKIDRYI